MNISSSFATPPVSAPASTPFGDVASAPTADDSAAVSEFKKWSQLSPAEKMRQAILQSMGLDEDKLKAMDPKERAKVEEKIKELMRQKVEQDAEKKTGLLVDVKA